jgi:hypothetical protein
MKKSGHHETRVTRGFVGSLVRFRLADFLNIRLLLMDAIRRCAARRGSARVSEKRTYVFILVPCGFRGNGHARKAPITRDLIGNGGHADGTRTDAFLSTVAARDRASFRMTSEPDLSENRELNYDLMWTWFLPNPLWSPKRRKRRWFSSEQAAQKST